MKLSAGRSRKLSVSKSSLHMLVAFCFSVYQQTHWPIRAVLGTFKENSSFFPGFLSPRWSHWRWAWSWSDFKWLIGFSEHASRPSHSAQSPKNHHGIMALPSGKFLRVRKVFAHNPWSCTGNFPDRLENFQVVLIFSRWSVKFPNSLETFRIGWIFSGHKNNSHTLFFVAKTIYSFFYRKNDLRTLSGKFLCVESCHPESSDSFRNFRQLWQFRFCTDFRTVVFLVNGVSKNTYSLYTFTIAPRGI